MQPERHAVPHAAGCAVPGEAVVADAEADLGAGPDRLRDHRLGRADAQVQAADPAVERGALHLVDHGPAALVPVLDREDAAVGQNADRQPGLVRDAAQAEIAFAGRLEGAGGGRHAVDLPFSGRRPWPAAAYRGGDRPATSGMRPRAAGRRHPPGQIPCCRRDATGRRCGARPFREVSCRHRPPTSCSRSNTPRSIARRRRTSSFATSTTARCRSTSSCGWRGRPSGPS